MIFAPRFRAKFQSDAFCFLDQILQKQIRKLPKIMKSVKINQSYSLLFIRVLIQHRERAVDKHVHAARDEHRVDLWLLYFCFLKNERSAEVDSVLSR